MVAQSVECQVGAQAWTAAITAWGRYGPAEPPARVEAVPDAVPVPPPAILLLERSHRSVGADSLVTPTVVQEHQREECPRLPLLGHQVTQQPSEPNRLRAQILSDRCVTGGRGITFGEDQVDAGGDLRNTFGQKVFRR